MLMIWYVTLFYIVDIRELSSSRLVQSASWQSASCPVTVLLSFGTGTCPNFMFQRDSLKSADQQTASTAFLSEWKEGRPRVTIRGRSNDYFLLARVYAKMRIFQARFSVKKIQKLEAFGQLFETNNA